MTPPLTATLDDARAMQSELEDLRHLLHRQPEIGLELPRTQETVLEALAGLDLEVSTGASLTSVTAVLRGGGDRTAADRPLVLLRGDMDALPVHEQVDVPFRSEVDGAMHACGHDLHTTMLVGAARLLAARRAELPGDVLFMFQPGEEGWDGAGAMLGEGLLDAAGRRPSAAWALHVMSHLAPRGTAATRGGPLMAASDGLYVRVTGRGGHGSSPHLAVDPVPAVAAMVTALHTVLGRTVDPQSPAVLTVGRLEAGTKRNIIPETASFDATIRTFDPAVRQQVAEMAVRVCEGIGAAHGVHVEATFSGEYPVTVNDEGSAATALAVAAELFDGERAVEMDKPIMGSEDFSRVLMEVPGAMVFVGACLPDRHYESAPANHSPFAAFDDAVLADGTALYASLALRSMAG